MTYPRHFRLRDMALLCALAFPGISVFGEAVIVNDAPRPHVKVTQAVATPLVTANADDPAWSQATRIPLDTLSLSTTPPPAIPIPGTEVRLLWDADWLYVRFLCKDDHPYLPFHGPNAPIYKGDVVEIFLDPVGDCREWMELEFNASNDVYNQITVCTAEPKWDRSLRLNDDFIARDVWTFPNPYLTELRSAAAPWKVNGQTVGWIVDAAIPAAGILKRSGLKKLGAMTLRGNFLRYKSVPQATGTKRDLLSLTWSPVVLFIPHRCPAAFGFIDLSTTP
jgi:Carbohydrate family 9 binding domain-like